ARGRGDVGDVARARRAERAGRRVRRDERPESPGRAAPDLVEAAHRLRLDDGDEDGLRGRLRARAQRPGAAGGGLGVPARGGAGRARAARGGRAVREDRAPDPGVAPPPSSWLTRLLGAPRAPAYGSTLAAPASRVGDETRPNA